MDFFLLDVVFSRTSHFLPKTCPFWLSSPGHGDTGILETGAKKFNRRSPVNGATWRAAMNHR
jgi:hypothetical protein